VEQDSIERIRSATFSLARRGYERREVDTFLGRLADWLEAGGGDRARSDAIKRELERIGQRTAQILTAAEEAAEGFRGDAQAEATDLLEEARLRAESNRTEADRYAQATRAAADEYAEKKRGDADAYSNRTRSEADAYSEKTRTEADLYAGETEERAEEKARELIAKAEAEAQNKVAKAEADVKRVIEDGQRRRREIESLISDLEQRRDAALAGIEQLRSELAGAATHHGADDAGETETRKLSRAAAPAEAGKQSTAPSARSPEQRV
jgi:DivIVA domain-containing protein